MNFQKKTKNQRSNEENKSGKEPELYEDSEVKEDSIKDRSKLNNAVIAVSSRLMSVDVDKFDVELQRALQKIGKSIGADRAFVCIFKKDSETVGHIYEWRSDGVNPSKEKFEDLNMKNQYPLFYSTITESDILYVPSVSDLPGDAKAEKNKMQKDGTKSLVLIPLVHRGDVIGGLIFDFLKKEKAVPNEDLLMLKMLGEIFASVLKKADIEKEFIESEKRYRNIFDNVNEGIYQSTPEGRFLSVNPAFASMLGYNTPKEVLTSITNIAKQLYHYPEEREAFKKLMTERGEVKDYRCIFKRKDGTSLSVSTSARAVRDRYGKILHYEGRISQTASKKEVDKALQRYETLMNNAKEVFIITDKKGNIVEANQAVSSTYGYDKNVLLTMRIHDLHAPHTRESVQHYISASFTGGIHIETEHMKSDGTMFSVEMSSNGLITGGEELVMSIVRDISSKKFIGERKEIIKENVVDYMRFVPEATFAIDTDGKIIAWNHAMERFTGTKSTSILGKDDYAYASPILGTKRPLLVDYVLGRQKEIKEDYTFIIEEGEVVVAEFNQPVMTNDTFKKIVEEVSLIRDHQGKITGAVETVKLKESRTERIEVPAVVHKQPDFSPFERVPVGIWVLNDQLQTQYANDEMKAVVGYDTDDIVGQSFETFLFQEDCEEFARKFQISDDGAPFQFEQRLRWNNGDGREVMISATPLLENSKVVGFWNVVCDVKEQVKYDVPKDKLLSEEGAEENSETESHYQSVFSNIPLGLSICSIDGKIIESNAFAADITGYSEEELSSKQLFSFTCSTRDSDRLKELFRRTAVVTAHEVPFKKKSGEIYMASLNIIPLPDGEEPLFALMLSDVTERRRAEDKLHLAEKRYRNIFENALEGIFQCTPKGKIVIANTSMARIFGYESPQEMVDSIKDFMNECCAEPQKASELQQLLKLNGIVEDFESEALKKDGTTIWISQNIRTVRDESGNVVYYEGSVADITNRKNTWESHQEEDLQFEDLFEKFDDALLVLKEGKILKANGKASALFERDESDMIGMSLSDLSFDLQAEENASSNFLSQAFEDLQRGETPRFRWHCSRKNGISFPALVRIGTLGGEEKNSHYIIIGDATEIEKSEQVLKKNTAEFRKAIVDVADLVALAVESRDPYSAGHQKRVAHLASAIAEEMGIGEEQIECVRFASFIHDIGKISVPADVLCKQKKLSDMVQNLVKNHSEAGYQVLKDIRFPYPVADIVHQHHERFDGSGYPSGLKGEEILIEARIIAVADVVEAMSSPRSYRPAYNIEMALDEIAVNKGSLYDETVVDTCVRLFREKGFSFD